MMTNTRPAPQMVLAGCWSNLSGSYSDTGFSSRRREIELMQ